jgi:hypothetical protein
VQSDKRAVDVKGFDQLCGIAVIKAFNINGRNIEPPFGKTFKNSLP